jgi:hypothetical protein
MAKVVSIEPNSVALSVSPKGYAGVNAIYEVELSAGHNEVVLQGLPTTIVPESLDIDDEFTGGDGALSLDSITLLPATETFDEVDALLKGSEAVLHFGDKGAEVSGTIRLKQGSNVLIQTMSGLRRVQDVIGYTLPQTPDGLTDTPYLALEVTAAAAGKYQLVLTYNAMQISYALAHQVIYDEKASALASWKTSVIVSNGAGATFKDALVYVVAGDTGEEQADYHQESALESTRGAAVAASFSPRVVAQGASRQSASSDSLGGNAVSYKLPKNVTLRKGSKTKPGKTKLTLLQSTGAIPVKRVNHVDAAGFWWQYDNSEQEGDVVIKLSFDNTKDNNFGERIPGANVSFRVRNAEKFLQPSGGDTLADTAIGDEVELSPGTDFDIKVIRKLSEPVQKTKPEVVERTPLQPPANAAAGTAPRDRVTYRVLHTAKARNELFNGKDHDVVVTVHEMFGECKLLGRHDFVAVDARTHAAEFNVGHTDADRNRVVEFVVHWKQEYTRDEDRPAAAAPVQS